jgi:hypothetical protein
MVTGLADKGVSHLEALRAALLETMGFRSQAPGRNTQLDLVKRHSLALLGALSDRFDDLGRSIWRG